MRGQRPKERWEINQGFRNQHQAAMMPQLGEEDCGCTSVSWVKSEWWYVYCKSIFEGGIRGTSDVISARVWTTQWASVPSSIFCEDGFSLPTRPFQNSIFRRTTLPFFECVLYPIFALNPHWSLAQYGAMSICKRLPASLRKLYLNWKDRGRWCCGVCLLN